jgi:tripartite-type tricarboxylate transporter receptor subunit TctC
MKSAVIARLVGLLAVALVAWPAMAEPVAEFYSGKRVSIYVGSATGGGYDAYARLVARHLSKHIPGNPTVVVMNMPGAGGIKAANYLYRIAPQDGTALGAFQREQLTMPLLEPRNTQLEYDPRKFNWLGSLNSETGVIIASASAPHRTMKDVFQTDLVVASTGPASDYLAKFLNVVLGTKFKLVTGYKSSTDAYLALERGEVQGRISQGWTGDRAVVEPWHKAGKVNFLAVVGLKPSSYFPGLPLVTDFATTDKQRQVLQLILVSQLWGRPFALPPEVPADRVTAMRKAFSALLADPAFLEEAERLKLDLAPVAPEEIERLLADAYASPADVVEAARAGIALDGR